MSSEMRDVVVSVKGISKCFEVYEKPIDRLKQTLWRGKRRFYSEFWALRDVSFDLASGESLGIIGRNGAGKSTLLQIIAGTMEASAGAVAVKRRVAAMLELGSGFNFEFTGRENVFLNGVILGVDESVIQSRFAEIEAFAGIGQFIDRPVKTYSTGMVVRLAFAVQVLLDPQILIVDEALAVGDAAFQIKCMNHMRSLLERGVSIILVTHDINTVRSFCDTVLWLDGGEVAGFGEPADVTASYMASLVTGERMELPATSSDSDAAAAIGEASLVELEGQSDLARWGDGWARFERVGISSGGSSGHVFEHGKPLRIEAEYVLLEDASARNFSLAFSIKNQKGLDIICYTTWHAGVVLVPGRVGVRQRAAFELENILAPGDYAITIAIEDVVGEDRTYADFIENAAMIKVVSDFPVYSNVLPRVEHTIIDVSESQS